jgi:hypothetical protein
MIYIIKNLPNSDRLIIIIILRRFSIFNYKQYFFAKSTLDFFISIIHFVLIHQDKRANHTDNIVNGYLASARSWQKSDDGKKIWA